MYVAAETSVASIENTTAQAGKFRSARRCPSAVFGPRLA
jgi:hypothetical protein